MATFARSRRWSRRAATFLIALLAPLGWALVPAGGSTPGTAQASLAGTAAAAATAPGPYPVGLSDHTLAVAGATRQFRIHVPAQAAAAPRALVLVLHGGGGEGGNVAELGRHPLSVFRTVADREGFVAVYPIGLPGTDGRTGWSDCRADDQRGMGADDVRFLAALIEHLRALYRLSASQVFMAGGSNGALMTLAFAHARPDAVGAVATSGGNEPAHPKEGSCRSGPDRPVPILLSHGTGDKMMPYAGGCVANLGGSCSRGRVIAAEATRDQWLRINRAGPVPNARMTVNIDPNDAGPAHRHDYVGAAPVQWWQLEGAGHVGASREVRIPSDKNRGVQNRDVEFAEIAWAFFASRLPR